MAAKPTKKKAVRRKSSKPAFMNFNKRNYSKQAQSYHHEVQHLIIDLLSITERINRNQALCQYFIDNISKKDMVSPKFTMEYFEDTIYHLENHAFRASAYRDKLVQFINQALELGYDERERGMVQKLIRNRISIEALTHTEVKKFLDDPVLKSVLSKRVSLSHLTYYGTDYSPYLAPRNTDMSDRKKYMKEWKQNISEQVEIANKFTLKAMDIANKVMTKINAYRAKKD